MLSQEWCCHASQVEEVGNWVWHGLSLKLNQNVWNFKIKVPRSQKERHSWMSQCRLQVYNVKVLKSRKLWSSLRTSWLCIQLRGSRLLDKLAAKLQLSLQSLQTSMELQQQPQESGQKQIENLQILKQSEEKTPENRAVSFVAFEADSVKSPDQDGSDHGGLDRFAT